MRISRHSRGVIMGLELPVWVQWTRPLLRLGVHLRAWFHGSRLCTGGACMPTCMLRSRLLQRRGLCLRGRLWRARLREGDEHTTELSRTARDCISLTRHCSLSLCGRRYPEGHAPATAQGMARVWAECAGATLVSGAMRAMSLTCSTLAARVGAPAVGAV